MVPCSLEGPAGSAGTAAIRAAFAEHGVPAAIAAAGAGVLADLLQPAVPAAALLCLAGALVAVPLALLLFVRPRAAHRLAPVVVLAALMATAGGGFWQMQRAGDAADGALAALIPAVAAAQQRLGIAAAPPAAAREAGFGGTVRLVADAGRAFAAEPQAGAARLYAEARLAEARGDVFAARRAYLRLAGLDPDAVDVWSRLAALLRVQDGRAGAREVFAGLAARARSPAYELVAATLGEEAERRRRLETFVAMNPDDGAGWYLLAGEVSEARLGSQTLSEKRRERDALARFLAAAERGTLARRFLDPGLLAEWLADAETRKTRLDAVLAGASSEPRAIFTRSSADWSVYVQLPEPATGFAYRLGDQGPFVSPDAGFGTDMRTGRPMPNTSISVAPGAEPKAIEVTYLDLRGQEVGPFRIPFDPMSALVGQQKQALEMTKGSWVAFRETNGLLVYTTHLMTYRCTIARASYGLDSEPVDKVLPLPACDTRDPFALPSGATPYFKVPAATRSMTVRLQFRDGTVAETTIARR